MTPRLLSYIFAIALVLGGCTDRQPQPTSPAEPATSAASPFHISLETEPARPKMATTTTFRAKVTDAQGAPVEGAQVRADLVMPLMDMGKNQVQLSGRGGGVYEGTGQFSMSGPWEARVTVKSGDKATTKVFDISVNE